MQATTRIPSPNVVGEKADEKADEKVDVDGKVAENVVLVKTK